MGSSFISTGPGFDRIEDIMGKGENASLFLFFSNNYCFQAYFFTFVKCLDCELTLSQPSPGFYVSGVQVS